MKIEDLDVLISQREAWVKHRKSLDVPEGFSGTPIWDIYQDIFKTADELTDEVLGAHLAEEMEQTPKTVSAQYIRSTHKYQILKRIESKFRCITFYNDYIRPKIKNRISYLFEGQVLDGKELLSYQNEQFIQVAYRSILNREADAEDVYNALIALHQPGAHRIDLLIGLCGSEEGKKRRVRIKKIWFKRLGLKAKRFLLRIPFINYVMRWVSALILLPRRLRELHNRITDIELYKIYQISNDFEDNAKKTAHAEEKIVRLQNDFTTLKNKIGQEEQRNKDLVLQSKQAAASKKKIIDKMYYDYKHDLMVKDFDTYRQDINPYLQRLESWTGNRLKKELKIVDLGCGFGEWVRIMQDAGYSPIGVDSNELMMNEALNNHLPVVKEDAMTYLNNTGTQTLDVLFSFHLIEHFTFGELIDFMTACNRVLKPGGLFVCATPNPENLLTATKEFYMDPTHVKPIPIELLEFYFKEFGFDVMEKLKLNPRNEWSYEYKQDDTMSNLVFRFNMEQESSVWGVKR